MSQPNKVLITGGAGFIGSRLGLALSTNNVRVTLLDNLRFGHPNNLLCNGRPFGEFLCRDIREPGLHTHFSDVDCVVHLAGIAPLPVCQADPNEAYEVNVGGLARTLEYARQAGVRRVIFSSTGAVYEGSPGEVHSENDPIRPNLIYALTKSAAEDLCRSYAENYGMDIVVCRFFNVYGPHQDVARTSPPFTSYVAREISQGKSPTLFNQSDAKRDYVHVDDVISLLTRMMESPREYRGDIFNVGSGKGYSVPELFDTLLRISGRTVEAIYGDPSLYWEKYPSLFAGPAPLRQERVIQEVHKNSVANAGKAIREFAWQARIGIEEGLRSVYEYVQRFASPDTTPCTTTHP